MTSAEGIGQKLSFTRQCLLSVRQGSSEPGWAVSALHLSVPIHGLSGMGIAASFRGGDLPGKEEPNGSTAHLPLHAPTSRPPSLTSALGPSPDMMLRGGGVMTPAFCGRRVPSSRVWGTGKGGIGP